MSTKRCYYETLEVERNADETKLKSAFRKLAMKWHPDRNPGDAQSEIRFKEINEAYEVLKDSDKRAAYDCYGHAAFEQGGGRGFGAGFAHMRQAHPVGFGRGRIGQLFDRGAQRGARAPVGGAVEDPAAFLEAFQQPRLAQKLEMTGDPRLGLAHNLDQFADGQFGLAQQQQQPKPGGIPGGAQHGDQLVHQTFRNI